MTRTVFLTNGGHVGEELLRTVFTELASIHESGRKGPKGDALLSEVLDIKLDGQVAGTYERTSYSALGADNVKLLQDKGILKAGGTMSEDVGDIVRSSYANPGYCTGLAIVNPIPGTQSYEGRRDRDLYIEFGKRVDQLEHLIDRTEKGWVPSRLRGRVAAAAKKVAQHG